MKTMEKEDAQVKVGTNEKPGRSANFQTIEMINMIQCRFRRGCRRTETARSVASCADAEPSTSAPLTTRRPAQFFSGKGLQDIRLSVNPYLQTWRRHQ
jgi:hypothetical protein